MELTILTVNKKIFQGNISSLTVPGTAGAFQILTNHAPIISSLEKGNIVYINDTEKNELAIESGVISAHNNLITILVEV